MFCSASFFNYTAATFPLCRIIDMKSSFRQHLLKWRASLGAITLLCLLWHIFLPTMVHIGVVPALYAMPSHCQVTNIQNSLIDSEAIQVITIMLCTIKLSMNNIFNI
jgi:hypothetical protein